MRLIKIFDTTLRDGAQSASARLRQEDKKIVAAQLETLCVDVIEAGFPASSSKESEAVKEIAQRSGVTIAGLARATHKDVFAAWQALQYAQKPRFHLFIASSKNHMEEKLHMNERQVMEKAHDAIAYAKSISQGRAEIEFSAEDATRSDRNFLVKLYGRAIDAGAGIINIPDTVGYALPKDFAELTALMKHSFPKTEISVHCHNDLGLAVANSLAAVQAGASQVQCTMNSIGERAGNASLEEIVTVLKVRQESIGAHCTIRYEKILETAELVSRYFGIPIPEYKAVIGKNAAKHEAGIHVQHIAGYESYNPHEVGAKRGIVLGRHSGIHTVHEYARMTGVAGNVTDDLARKILNTVKDKDLKITTEDSFRELLSQHYA